MSVYVRVWDIPNKQKSLILSQTEENQRGQVPMLCYVQDFVDGKISREAFWALARFKHPIHQISFHTISALDTPKYEGSEEVYGRKK